MRVQIDERICSRKSGMDMSSMCVESDHWVCAGEMKNRIGCGRFALNDRYRHFLYWITIVVWRQREWRESKQIIERIYVRTRWAMKVPEISRKKFHLYRVWRVPFHSMILNVSLGRVMIICPWTKKKCEVFISWETHKKFAIFSSEITIVTKKDIVEKKHWKKKTYWYEKKITRDPRRTKSKWMWTCMCVFSDCGYVYAYVCDDSFVSEDTTRSCSFFFCLRSSKFPCDTTRLRLYVLSWLWNSCICVRACFLHTLKADLLR